MRRRTGIFRRPLSLVSAALLAGSVCLLPSAAVDGAEPEVTMRVLDDASDAAGLLAEAAAEQSEARAKRRTVPERRATGADNENRTDDAPAASDRSVELDTVVDRDQEGESEIEDRDAPEDIDFEPASEDEG